MGDVKIQNKQANKTPKQFRDRLSGMNKQNSHKRLKGKEIN